MAPKTKQCTKCKQTLPLSEFNKRTTAPDGLQWTCRNCRKDHYRSKRGVIWNTYYRQTIISEMRGHKQPDYTRKELTQWMNDQPIFHKLHKEWVESGYKRLKAVSCDRIDDYKGYTFDNLIITTWKQNKLHADSDSKLGINNKRSTSVAQYDKKTGEFIGEYYSQSHAMRITGTPQTSISLCITGKAKTANGYIWKVIQKNGK